MDARSSDAPVVKRNKTVGASTLTRALPGSTLTAVRFDLQP